MKLNKQLLLACLLLLLTLFFIGCNITDTDEDKNEDKIVKPDEEETNGEFDELNNKSSILYAQSRQYSAEGRYKQALEVLWEIPPSSSIFEAACLDMINIAIALDDIYSVLYGARRYLQINPQDTSVMYIYAEYLFIEQEHITKAEKILLRLLKINQDVKAYELLARIQLLKTEFMLAEQTLNQLKQVLAKVSKNF